MTLLISIFAAVIFTVVWYKNDNRKELSLSTPCWLFWGSSLMWMADAVFEYAEMGAEFFSPSASDMLNDTYLGLSVVALGMIIWVVVLLIKDPKGVIKETLSNSNN